MAGEPLDFRVNDRLVARGEAVVINDRFGVRLTDVIGPATNGGIEADASSNRRVNPLLTLKPHGFPLSNTPQKNQPNSDH